MDFKLKNKTGIYKISNTINDRIYIGSAVDLYNRFHLHKSDLNKNKHHSKTLQRFVNKYGFENLVFSLIEACIKSDLLKKEQYWLDTLSPFYNNCKIAGSQLGVIRSAEIRLRASKRMKGSYPTHFIGKNHTPEARRKISESAKNRGLHINFINASIIANTGRKQPQSEIDKRAKIQTKITPEQCAEIIQLRSLGIYQKDIAKRFGISQRLVCRIEHGIGIYGNEDYYRAGKARFDAHVSKYCPASEIPVTSKGELKLF